MTTVPCKARPFERERRFLLETWLRTFDLGGEHHAKAARDEGTVDHIAEIVAHANRTATVSESTVARVVFLLINGHPFGTAITERLRPTCSF